MSRKRRESHYFANNSSLFRGRLAIDKMYDRVISDGYNKSAPPTVYHYTSWNGAQEYFGVRDFGLRNTNAPKIKPN